MCQDTRNFEIKMVLALQVMHEAMIVMIFFVSFMINLKNVGSIWYSHY